MDENHALRAKMPVHEGESREILDLPSHERHVFAAGHQHHAAHSYESCEMLMHRIDMSFAITAGVSHAGGKNSAVKAGISGVF